MSRPRSKAPATLKLLRGGSEESGSAPSDETQQDDPDRTVRVERAFEGDAELQRPLEERDPLPEDVVSGRYRLEQVLGEGGMGKVFLATDLLYQQEYGDSRAEVAIKFLGRKFAEHSSARIALQRETRKSQELSHPNIVRVMHFDHHGPHAYMIMEYMHGKPLDSFIRDQAPTGLPLEQALPLIDGMSQGLAYIHDHGLVHSDLKPNNVFVGDDGTVKILDLGIARAREDGSGQSPETRFDPGSLGALTPAYASCEMFEGLPPDPRDDIYALACVAYELLTGHHPFNGTWALKARSKGLQPQRVPGLNGRRWGVLARALEFDRDHRLASASEFSDGLADTSVRRKRMVWGLGGFSLASVVAVSGFAVVAIQPPDPDQLFLDTLVPSAPVALSEPEMRRVERWMEQGGVYLQYAKEEFARGNLDVAHHVLKGGADNAYWAFSSVLERVDSEPAKRGVMEIVNAYADWADATADQGNLTDALWTACQGLAIHPRHVRLNELAHEVSVELTQAQPDATTNCDRLAELAQPPSSI